MESVLSELADLEDPERAGFLDLRASRTGLDASLGRRWLWSSSRLSVGLRAGTDWAGEWDIGAGLRYEF